MIPGWSKECEELYDTFHQTGDVDTGKELLKQLDQNRRSQWESKMESVNFTRSSKKAWNLINRLSGKSPKDEKLYPVTPEQIASQLVKNSKGNVSPTQKRRVNKQYAINFYNRQLTSSFSVPFSEGEIRNALNEIECGKAPGQDNVFPEYLKRIGPNAVKWLNKLFSKIYQTGQIPKQWKRAKVITFLKPNKSAEDPANYRPISLLSCCFKLFERTILSRLQDTMDNGQCDQVISLTNYIELGFQKGLKTGVVFVDLTAANDTVWKRGLLMKLSAIIPCRTTLTLVTNMLSDRCFRVEMNGKKSNKRILNNGLPQGSVLSCFFYCLYTSDIPNTRSRKFMYAADIAMAF